MNTRFLVHHSIHPPHPAGVAKETSPSQDDGGADQDPFSRHRTVSGPSRERPGEEQE